MPQAFPGQRHLLLVSAAIRLVTLQGSGRTHSYLSRCPQTCILLLSVASKPGTIISHFKGRPPVRYWIIRIHRGYHR